MACHFECSNCEEQEKCKELRPWDYEESEEEESDDKKCQLSKKIMQS